MLYERSPIAAVLVNKEEIIVEANLATKRLLKLDKRKFGRVTFSSCIHPEDIAIFKDGVQNVWHHAQLDTIDLRLREKMRTSTII